MVHNLSMVNQTITLIGPPGAGKSTLGVQLASRLGKAYFDTDRLLEEHTGMSLQSFLNSNSYLVLRQQEEAVVLNTDFDNAVIATGGSVVYSEKAMRKLAESGPCIFLKITFEDMSLRIGQGNERGLAIAPETTLLEMYNERTPLYQRWASYTLDCHGRSEQSLLSELLSLCSLKPL